MNERIFVIEDDENIREIINLALVSNGYEVVQFDNAIDALELMKKEMPSLAIFDLMLPKMSGIDAVSYTHLDVYKRQVPGTAFGQAGEGFIRVSYAYSIEQIKEATTRIKKFLDKLDI